ncbi:MAG: nitronate monooxygenase [bacterium]|nr:nitronate monooxygenase [bacterium]
MPLPKLTIRGREIATSIVQGGMGVGVSWLDLVVAVIMEGGLGTLSSAAIDRLVYFETGKKMPTREATCWAVKEVKRRTGGGYVGINIMQALVRDYVDSVLGAVDGGVDFIMASAGLHLRLPEIVGNKDVALIPIVSSDRALKIICGRWKSRHNRLPDAVILEGPQSAGGHLGVKIGEIDLEENKLENLFPPIKQYANFLGILVIVAGGLFYHTDILRWHALGADGAQFGTRLLATKESGASPLFKQELVKCGAEGIIVAYPTQNYPGSSSGLPFRVIKSSPAFTHNQWRKNICDKGYIKPKDRDCPAKSDPERHFCICNSLLAAIGYGDGLPLFTTGTNGALIKEISTVARVMKELRGEI